MNGWKQNDEQRLTKLRVELILLEDQRKHATERLARALAEALHMPIDRTDIGRFIGHADAIRDALEPFDSGIRATDDPTPDPDAQR